MKTMLITAVCSLFLNPTIAWAENWLPQNKDDLGKHWQWVRPVKGSYQFKNNQFIVRSFPGNIWAKSKDIGKNFLIRPFQKDNVSITLKVSISPTIQGDQAGIMFYHDDDHYIKIVREYMGDTKQTEILLVREQNAQGKILGRVASKPKTVEVRFERRGKKVSSYYREGGNGPFLKVGEGVLPEIDKPLFLCLFTSGCPEEVHRDTVFHSLHVEALPQKETP